MGFLLRGMLIGLLFGLLVGAVGALTVQRAWGFGVKAGLLTGLGSSVADCFYACVGAFGLTLISDFLLKWQAVIAALGGCAHFADGVQVSVLSSGGTAARGRLSGRNQAVSHLLRHRYHQPSGYSHLPLCLFLLWHRRCAESLGGLFSGGGCILRHLLLVGNPYRPDPLGAAQGRKTVTFHYESNLRCGVVPIWRNRVLTAAPLPHFLKAVTTHETAFCLTDLSPGDSAGPCGLRTKRPAREYLPYDLFGGKRVPRGSAGTYPLASGQQRDIPYSQPTA